MLWCRRLEREDVGSLSSSSSSVSTASSSSGGSAAMSTNMNNTLRTFCALRLIPILHQNLRHFNEGDDTTLRRWFTDMLADAVCIVCFDKPIAKVINTLPAGSPLFGFGGPSICGFDESASKHLEQSGLLFLSNIARMAPQCTTTKDFRDLVMDGVVDNVFSDTVTGSTDGNNNGTAMMGGINKSTSGTSSKGGRNAKRAKKLLGKMVVNDGSVDMIDATATSSQTATVGQRNSSTTVISGFTSPEMSGDEGGGFNDDVADGSLHRLFS
jgi:hypothetical protein